MIVAATDASIEAIQVIEAIDAIEETKLRSKSPATELRSNKTTRANELLTDAGLLLGGKKKLCDGLDGSKTDRDREVATLKAEVCTRPTRFGIKKDVSNNILRSNTPARGTLGQAARPEDINLNGGSKNAGNSVPGSNIDRKLDPGLEDRTTGSRKSVKGRPPFDELHRTATFGRLDRITLSEGVTDKHGDGSVALGVCSNDDGPFDSKDDFHGLELEDTRTTTTTTTPSTTTTTTTTTTTRLGSSKKDVSNNTILYGNKSTYGTLDRIASRKEINLNGDKRNVCDELPSSKTDGVPIVVVSETLKTKHGIKNKGTVSKPVQEVIGFLSSSSARSASVSGGQKVPVVHICDPLPLSKSIDTEFVQAPSEVPGIHQRYSRHKTLMLDLAGALVILLCYVVNQFTAVIKAKLQTQSSKGRTNRPVWSINLLFACSLIGTTQGSFVKQDSEMCTALTNGFLVKNFDDCGKGNAALGWSGALQNIPPAYGSAFAGGCFHYFPWSKPLMNIKFDSLAPCSGAATCICWQGAVCSNVDGTAVNPTDCMCGTKICDAAEGLFCQSSIEKCSKTAALPPCTATDGLVANSFDCACGGSIDCDASSGHFCSSSIKRCAKVAACTTTDGSAANANDCACGVTDCTTLSGLFCDIDIKKGNGQCSVSSDKWFVTQDSGNCATTSGRSTILDTDMCKVANDAVNLVSAHSFPGDSVLPIETAPTGCYSFTPIKRLVLNTLITSVTPCSASRNCICFVGPECTDTNRAIINSESCRCGTNTCTASSSSSGTHGLFCLSADSRCSDTALAICSDTNGQVVNNEACCRFKSVPLS